MGESIPCNADKAMDVGSDKAVKEFTDKYDLIHGLYKVSDGGKPTKAAGSFPADPKPFEIKK